MSPEIVALKPVNMYNMTEIIIIRSFKLRTGVERKILYFWRDKLEGSWSLLNKVTLQEANKANFFNYVNTPTKPIRQETN